LIESLEAGCVVGVVRSERDAEEVSVGQDVVLNGGRVCSTHPTHLTVHQLHVEIRKLDVVALRIFPTTVYKQRPENVTQILRMYMHVGYTVLKLFLSHLKGCQRKNVYVFWSTIKENIIIHFYD